MPDPVGSTSWPNRHARTLTALADLLSADARPRTILIVGPGGATRLLSRFLRDSGGPSPPWLVRVAGDLARYADQLLRRVPFLPLVSFEPLEVVHALGRQHRLIVVDRSQRVLRAVARDLPDAMCRSIDLSRDELGETADVVIAFNVVSRIESGGAALARLARAVRPAGLLLVDDRSAARWPDSLAGFAKVAEKIHRRAADAG